jgi:hypothetical protein
VLGEHLAEDALALEACARDRLERVDARRVDEVDRESGWPSGPVMPRSKISFCRRKTSSPFSACTVQSAPSSRARMKDETRISSSAMIAPLYAMKCLNELTPWSFTSVPMSS